MMGPLGIAKASARSAARAPDRYFFLIAIISLQVGILNLFPLAPLDGGHLAIIAAEGLIRRDLSIAVKAWIMNAGALVIFLLIGVVLYSDLSKTSWLGRVLAVGGMSSLPEDRDVFCATWARVPRARLGRRDERQLQRGHDPRPVAARHHPERKRQGRAHGERATGDRRAGRVLSGQGRPSAESVLHLALVRFRSAGAIAHTTRSGARCSRKPTASMGGLCLEGYEMLKGLAGVTTHAHRERLPIIENTQDWTAASSEIEECSAGSRRPTAS
jgi:hypothetical protein